MQRYTTFFITVNAVHVSGGFSALHQELKNCTHSLGHTSSLLAATANVDEFRRCILLVILKKIRFSVITDNHALYPDR